MNSTTQKQRFLHWEQYPGFSEAFPEIECVQTTFEIDGDIHSCPGGDVPFDMFLRVVESDHSSSVMNKAGDLGLANRVREASERQRQPISVRHEALAEIIRKMEDSVAEPVTLSTLAASSNLSRRQIERLFLKQLGCSPARYYLEMRLERAHLLLSSSRLSVTEIGIACGFGSLSYFSKTYRYSHGCTPQQARQAALERRAPKPGNAAAGARHSTLSSAHSRHVHVAESLSQAGGR
ncbi:GlxA family transcriptional regulator [Aminobacter sp. UC22_36]|jgi:transcriptional regulator GlxA family with amidase domain|uniref:GlxA family transcriptional regulator n=1 Tax=Aminobacter sp. UC22_36 TaxID=3374549 RepID=UPI003757CCBF